ncbi:MAG: sensor histidine kinase [Chitinophagaceae bacterium]
MKRIFPIIIVLITMSLIGIIGIQISWLRNMQLLHQDQVKQKLFNATQNVANQLVQYKGSAVAPNKMPSPFSDNFLMEMARPYNISQRFTTRELYEKIRAEFLAQDLEKIPFEFGLATNVRTGEIGIMERQSPNFAAWYNDTVAHLRYHHYITPPSGSAAENLASDEMLIIVVPSIQSIARDDLQPRIIIAILFTLIIFAAFFLTVYAMLRQKKMSEIKNDFINNMTHEFKTPIATISLAVDALRNQKVQSDPQKMTYFSDIIKEENQRMNRQVETILKSALMDRQEAQLNKKPLTAHQIIQDVADNFMLRLQEKKGSLQLKLEAANDLIEADEVHFSNLVNNLLDNAVKYSKEDVPPQIRIVTYNAPKRLGMRIEDNGIGMNRETLKRVFEKFYRAHTGNIHNVKGFGLGLNYVKDIVEAHGGSVKAESTLGKGSCFTIEMPLQK